MPILFPLTLIGVGFLIYALFASATLALPIGAGLAAGFGSAALGIAPLPSVIIGSAAFMSVIAIGRFAALSVSNRPTRGVLIAVFAIPAAIAGFSVASAFASLERGWRRSQARRSDRLIAAISTSFLVTSPRPVVPGGAFCRPTLPLPGRGDGISPVALRR